MVDDLTAAILKSLKGQNDETPPRFDGATFSPFSKILSKFGNLFVDSRRYMT